jgi:hemerythrin
MALIEWSDKYSVNIALIDEQHKKLIDLLNVLGDAMTVGKGTSVLGNVLTDLVAYTKYHFNTEEELFIKHDYAGYDVHKQQHDDLTAQVVKLKEEFDKGNWMLTIDTMKFLSTWLTDHIVAEDKKYGPYLNEKGVR